MSSNTIDKVHREIRRGIIRKADLIRLVDEENIGNSIPSPHSGLGAVCAIRQLSNLAWTSLLEEAKQTTATGSTVQPDRERSGFGRLASLDEPEECVDRVVLLNGRKSEGREVDVTGVLLLGVEDSRACSRLWLLVLYGNVRIDWRLEDGGKGVALGRELGNSSNSYEKGDE